MIKNKISKKIYIGKSLELQARIDNYCDPHYLKNNEKSSNIYRAILKFGYENFSLSILELCEQKELASKEQFYLDK